MEVVRLTNIGNLTLTNLLGIEKKYGENAQLKRNKLAKLWDSEEDMSTFESMFSSYHTRSPNQVIVRDGESYFIRNGLFGKDTPIDPNTSEVIERFSQMGLVDFSAERRTLNEIISDIQKDGYANPAKYVRGITVELTGLCNLVCGHCYRGGSRKDEYGLPADEIKEALEPLLRAGIGSITFTGGEPTIRRDDLIDIIDYASQFLELKGVSVEDKLIHEYGTPNPTVNDVLKTDRYVRMRQELMTQLSLPKDQLMAGQYNICDENTPEDVEEMVRSQATWSLEYAKKPSDYNLDSIGVLSNGFFGDQRELVRKLKSYGNVSMQTSLDSNDEATTDRNRGRKGVFAKVGSLIQISKEESFDLSLQGHNLDGEQGSRDDYEGIRMFSIDGMLQLGNAVQGDYETRDTRSSTNYIGSLKSSNRHGDGWCKGFIRPDKLHIRPTGNVGNCLYAYAVPGEFGNLRSSSMAEIVNGMQDSEVTQMFRDGRIEQYQHELDKSLFPKTFSKSCEPVILTLTYGMVKERLVREGVENPVEMANQEVAKTYKFMK